MACPYIPKLHDMDGDDFYFDKNYTKIVCVMFA